MKSANKITETEWFILDVLWKASPLSAREIADQIPREAKVTLQTVRTLIERLLKKGAITRDSVHGVYVFSPKLSRDECVRVKSRGFLDRIFGGEPEPLLAHFIENEDLSREELERLREMLDRKIQENDE